MRLFDVISLSFAFSVIVFLTPFSCNALLLRDNLKRAQPGDYIVTTQGKNDTLLHIYAKPENSLIIEEISIPAIKIPKRNFSWSGWVAKGAPGNTMHVMYTVDLNTAQMKNYYSFTSGGWYQMSPQDNFLSTLLNLQFDPIPSQQRRRIGLSLPSGNSDRRALWQPKMVINGKTIPGITFDAWRATWPKDQSELSGRTIEVYLPEERLGYPAYFPYWLQISGFAGGAKVRIIDSGSGLQSQVTVPYPFTKN